MNNQPIKAEYSLFNVIECMKLLEDARNPNNGFIINMGYKWIREHLEETNELTTADREKFHKKFYLEAKNK